MYDATDSGIHRLGDSVIEFQPEALSCLIEMKEYIWLVVNFYRVFIKLARMTTSSNYRVRAGAYKAYDHLPWHKRQGWCPHKPPLQIGAIAFCSSECCWPSLFGPQIRMIC